ncbi:unnamed protein product [Caenorhabditis nigoni]
MEKKFSISQVFHNITSMKSGAPKDGDVVKRFGVYWKIQLFHSIFGEIYPYLICESDETNNWSINTVCEVLVGGKSFKTGLEWEFKENNAKLNPSYISRSNFSEYQIDESATIEYRVKIIKINGIERQKSLNFDDDVAKESSDVVLVIGDRKFYVCKMYLSFHSSYFKSLFSGNFQESQESEIELKDIDPQHFQDFLEVLYGEPSIYEYNCCEILKLADMYDANTVIRRCEDFLIHFSRKPLKVKFETAAQYKMDKLMAKCIPEIKTRDEVRSVMPEDANKIDCWAWKKLMEQLLTIS